MSKEYLVIVDGKDLGGDGLGIWKEFSDKKEAILEARNYFKNKLSEDAQNTEEVIVAYDLVNNNDDYVFQRTWSSNEYLDKVELIRNMSLADFSKLDEVSVESENYYYTDNLYDIDEQVPAATAYEDGTLEDNLTADHDEAWSNLRDKVLNAY